MEGGILQSLSLELHSQLSGGLVAVLDDGLLDLVAADYDLQGVKLAVFVAHGLAVVGVVGEGAVAGEDLSLTSVISSTHSGLPTETGMTAPA